MADNSKVPFGPKLPLQDRRPIMTVDNPLFPTYGLLREYIDRVQSNNPSDLVESSAQIKQRFNPETLIEKNSELRSLTYEEFGGEKPLVHKKIPSYTENGPSKNQVTARVDDLVRITKLLTKPAGLKFAANQAALQSGGLIKLVDNVKKVKRTSKGKSLVGAILQTAGQTILGTAKIIGSTLAQIPVNGTGTQFIRGFNPKRYIGGGGFDLFGFSVGNSDNIRVQSDLETRLSQYGTHTSDYNKNRLSIQNNSNVQYNGGKPYFNTNDSGGPVTNLVSEETGLAQYSPNTKTSTGRLGNTPSTPVRTTLDREKTNTENQKKIGESIANQVINPQDTPEKYSEQSDVKSNILHVRLRSGNQSRVKTADELKDKTISVEPDELNKLGDLTESILDASNQPKDIIPFEFNVISTGKYLYFRAHLENLSDNFTGRWNSTKYIGRAEDFYTYDGFDRDISFGFKVAAFSRAELSPLYKKLNLLANSTAPVYGDNGEFMRGTLTRITIGDYLQNQAGYIGSVGFNWSNNYPWEINLEEKDDIPRVPHVLDVSINFKPIHDFNIRASQDPTQRAFFAKGTWYQ